LVSIFIVAFDASHSVEKLFFKSSDKLKHIVSFFVMSYFFLENSINIQNKVKVYILIFIAFFIEFIQFFIGRESSILDFLSSLMGIVLFLAIKKIFMVKYFR
jgi:VanZ family protein